jgi:hypothetical protein
MNTVQIIKTVLILVAFCKINTSTAQNTFFNTSSREYHTIDRLDIKSSISKVLELPNLKPYGRKDIIDYVQELDSSYKATRMKAEFDVSDVDLYNMQKLLMTNPEWLKHKTTAYNSKKPFLNHFLKTKTNFYEVYQKDFTLILSPVIQQTQGFEINNKKRIYLNAKGFEMRGLLGNKIGFYSYITDNQENGARYYAGRVDSLRAAHGAGFYKIFKPQPGGTNKGQDYFDYRGYITFKLAKLIDVQYGYDKNFIGNGVRSLFLSDQSAPSLFLKLNTKIWKLNYQNLFMELAPTTTNNGGGAILDKKYAAMHHLGINLSENVSIGLFESIIFKRRKFFEFGYLVPVIFYRAVESGLGSGDNALIGTDFKINFDQHLQLYGQVILDEFKLSELRKKSWANKVGAQAGFKYVDVAGIKNLDFQLEWNIVRPYTYSHFDSATTYTHYNQPLAHPLGANFSDFVIIAKYQPKPKLYFESRLFIMRQGQDSTLNAPKTYGGNIFKEYNNRPNTAANAVVPMYYGYEASIVNFNALASYELRPNLYIEGNLQYRRFEKVKSPKQNALVVSLGVRWNMNRRDFDY